MKQRFLAHFLFAVSLAGCAINSQSVGQHAYPLDICAGENCPKLFTDPNFGYSVMIPTELSRWTRFSLGIDSSESYPTFTTPDGESNKVRATVFTMSSPCTPSLTGASRMTPLSTYNEMAEWGRVDYYDIYWTGDFPGDFAGLCSPGSGTGSSAYVLCSHRKGKTILLCISEAADNSTLAEQIFESFRWLN